MGEKENKYAPMKRFVFPAGDCGGEIRINIPVTASKADVIRMAKMLMVAAEDWEDSTAEYIRPINSAQAF